MVYKIIKPSEAIAPFVRFFWILEGRVEGGSFVHRSVADGCAEMIFHYKGSFIELAAQGPVAQTYSMLHAQTNRFRRFETKEPFGIFGVYLYPYVLPQLFSMPAYELSNQMPDLQTLLKGEGQILEERMMLAKDNEARLQIISSFLVKKLIGVQSFDKRIISAVEHLIQIKGAISVKQFSEKYCLSTRQFERKFKHFSGFSPKLYSRILRFGAATANCGNSKKTLTEIAFDCGYYDQSHFIHDFKEFSGYHPKEYFFGKPEGGQYNPQ